jgi:hypothetical protein
MYGKLNSTNVNLFEYPNVDKAADSCKEVTIGDLHGNFIKFLYFLINQNIVNIAEDDFNQLVTIYKQSPLLDDDNTIDKFEMLLSKINISDRKVKVRLLGDELSDRGQNDYFTLKLIQILCKNDIDLEILLSNHGLGFIGAMESNSFIDYYDHLQPAARSLINLQKLIKRRPDLKKEVDTIYSIYKLKLKAVSYHYSEEDESLVIYTHAPTDIRNLYYVAYQLDLYETENRDRSPLTVMKTIDTLNDKIQYYLEGGRLCRRAGGLLSANVIDRRGYGGLQTYSRIHYVHGHDIIDEGDLPKQFTCLDNELGKQSTRFDKPSIGADDNDFFGNVGEYTIYTSAPPVQHRPIKTGHNSHFFKQNSSIGYHKTRVSFNDPLSTPQFEQQEVGGAGVKHGHADAQVDAHDEFERDIKKVIRS